MHDLPDLPIPDRLNVALVALVSAAAVGLLWLASHVASWWAVMAIGVVFSYVLLTNYALLHEAAHHKLHSRRPRNDWLGRVTGLFFPCPFSMMHSMHQGHHLRNRTDHEMFDLYYPSDNRFVRYVQWYGILCGLFWPWVPIGAVLFAVCPAALRTRVFREARSSSYLLGDIRDADVRAIRREVIAEVVVWLALFWLLELRPVSVLVLYACFAFNWSTRQYIGHAFTKRDVVEGAWNLRHNRLMGWVLLNGQWDLNHHRYPGVPWRYLPQLSEPNEPRLSYASQYVELWRGPRPNTEPAPEALADLPLSIHS